MSEWTPSGNAWVEAWDDGTPASGFTMAESIHEAFAVGQATGYVSWFAASLGATRGFIQIASEGDGYRVSKRLWAFAAYSRFIRPGAVRVPATVGDPDVRVTAFRNADGSMIVELLNTGTASVSTSFTTDIRIHRATTYLTDETHSVERIGQVRPGGKHRLPVQVPARSLTTLVLR
jgi:glucosylceramidase